MPAYAQKIANAAIGAIERAGPRRTPDLSQPIWGDGLVDLSLSCALWYPRSWADVSDDELVLFLPSLLAADQAQEGAPVRIRNAFVRRLRASILILAQRDRLQAFHRIAETSAISGIGSDGNLSDWIWQTPTGAERFIADRCASRQSSTDWRFEIAVLACIDRMLAEAMNCPVQRNACLIDSPELTDALIASIHTSFNAAYAYSSYSFAHELLGTGAWLGMLLMGRSALMPEFVACVLIEHLVRPSQSDLVSDILRFHAERVGGVSFLIRHAQNVLKSGYPVVVKPGRATARAIPYRPWNPELERKISMLSAELIVHHNVIPTGLDWIDLVGRAWASAQGHGRIECRRNCREMLWAASHDPRRHGDMIEADPVFVPSPTVPSETEPPKHGNNHA